MTKKENLARQCLFQSVMQTTSIGIPEAKAGLAELEAFGLIKFDRTGRFYMQSLED